MEGSMEEGRGVHLPWQWPPNFQCSVQLLCVSSNLGPFYANRSVIGSVSPQVSL
jgi:hypothetical protein